VILPVEVVTVFAMANVLWKIVLVNSKVKEVGSVVLADHVIVIVPPVVAPVGVLMVKAETRGRARATAMSLANILNRECREGGERQ
jgi:hypothetical protein